MFYKKFIRLVFISTLIALFISLTDVFLQDQTQFQLDRFTKRFGVNFMFAFFLTLVNDFFFNLLNKWVPWSRQPTLRLILGVIGSVVLTLSVLFVLIGVTQIIIYDGTWERFIAGQSLNWYTYGVFITLFIAITFHAFYFYKELQRSKIKEQKIIAGSATAQFDALKNQLDPHFLFNSLNVLVSLIEENPDAAVNFTTSLSKVYRYVLEQRGKQLVSLEEELKFARTYVRLLKMRFEESLDITIPDQVSSTELQIIPLSLQLLIENAVKHNIINSSRPLQLSIYEEEYRLIIINNLQEKSVVNSGTGVGLSNIVARYALLTNDQMTIEKNKDSFKVTLPLLDQETINQTKTLQMEATLENSRLEHAKKKVKGIKEFYDEVLRTVVILAFLAILNYFTTDFPWVIFPAIGMGLGLFFQYLRSFDKRFFIGKRWEERKINELMNDQNF